MYKTLATYQIAPGLSLCLVRGSVVHFEGKTDMAAIVNAANPGCLGGGGVDGAISSAGGLRLMEDRLHLPVLERHGEYEIRCRVGSAVCTGPGDYDDLRVSYVLHAVGPNYHNYDEEDYDQAHDLLKSAYSTTLNVASESRIEEVGFCLLSAGIFRGSCSLEQVLRLGIESILSWGKNKPEDTSVSDIHVFAFTVRECKILKKICDQAFGIETEEASDSEEMVVDTEDTTTRVESEPVADEKMGESNDMEIKPPCDDTMEKEPEDDHTVEKKPEDDDITEKKLEKSVKADQKMEETKDERIASDEADAASSNIETKVEESASKKEQNENTETPEKSDVGEKSEDPKQADGETKPSTDETGVAENGSAEEKQDE